MLYNCEKVILTPPKNLIKCNNSNELKVSIKIDRCLSEDIWFLWSLGIKTCGCCCGHGRNLGFIQVVDGDIEKMKNLNYQHYIYEDEFGGINRKDAFVPKSYNHIYVGYTKYHEG